MKHVVDLSAYGDTLAAHRELDSLLALYAGDSTSIAYAYEFLSGPLADPNSPVRNEALFISLLDAVLASPYIDSVGKIKPAFQLEMAIKNRVGNQASDFSFRVMPISPDTTAMKAGVTGYRTSLYAIRSPFTLLYINNPGCHSCAQIRADIMFSPVVRRFVREGKLKIAGVYPDADLGEFRKGTAELFGDLQESPDGAALRRAWLNGYDDSLLMRTRDLYDISAIPSLYLLDASKNVLIKDGVDIGQIEEVLLGSEQK